MTEPPPIAPAASRNPRLPADHGLPALALLMKLQAGFFLIYGGFIVAFILLSGGRAFGTGEVTLALLVAVALGAIRGVAHLVAATHLGRRSPGSLPAARRYVVTAAATTLGTLVVMALLMKMPAPALVGIAVLLAFWPVTLGVLVLGRRSIRELFAASETFGVALIPSDRSIEGAGVLMTYLGAIGLTLSLYVLFALVTTPSEGFFGTVFVLVVALMVVRAVVHLRVGISAMGGLAPAELQRRVGMYFGLAVATVGGAALALLVASRGRGLLGLILVLGLVTALLLLWPLVLRAFASQAVMEDLAADGETIPFGPAPDRGLTALGYLLLLLGGAEAAVWLVQLLAAGAALALPGVAPDALGGLAGADLWLSPLVAAATLWAGRELVTMSPRYRRAAVVYAVVQLVAAGVGLVADDAALDALGTLHAPTAVFMGLLSLIVPVLALILTNRKLPAA